MERELFNNKHYLCSLSVNPNDRVIDATKKADFAVIARKKIKEIYQVYTNKPVPIRNGLRVIDFITTYNGNGFGSFPPFDIITIYDDKTRKYYEVRGDEVDFFAVILSDYLASL